MTLLSAGDVRVRRRSHEMSAALAASIIATMCLTSSTAVPKEPVEVGLKKQLLVDDAVIAEMHGVAPELGTVTKANDGAPIFTDGWFYGTVLHDRGRFKLWYRK